MFVCGVLGGYAQDQEKLRNAWQRYHDQALSSHERLVALDDVIYHVSRVDQDSSLGLSRRLLSEARAHGDTLMVGQAFRNIGIATFRTGGGEIALVYLDSSFRSCSLRTDSAYLRGAGATLSNMATIHQSLGRMSEAISYYHQSLLKHSAANNQRGLVYCYNNIGAVHGTQGRPDSALIYYEKAALLAQHVGLQDMAGTGYSNMANVYAETGKVGEAIDMMYRSMAIQEAANNASGVAQCLSQISDLRSALGEKADALAFMRRAYDLYRQADDRQGMIDASGGIGSMLIELGRYDSAAVLLEEALRMEREGRFTHLMDHTLLDLGTVYRLMGRHKEAEHVLGEALELARTVGDDPHASLVLAETGLVQLAQGRAEGAITHCKEGLKLALATGSRFGKRNSCECLYRAYKAAGNMGQALAYHEAYIGLRDSLTTEQAQRRLTQRDLHYTFGKKQLADSLRYSGEREQLENERTIEALRADQNRNKALATGAGGLLFIAGGTAWFMADRRRRKERFEKEAATLETQALRSQMNPHFIFNALNSINAYMQHNDLDKASTYLSKFARVMRSVLENSRHAEVPLQDDLDALRAYMELERMRMDGKFEISIQVDPSLAASDVLVPPLVVQPFVENAIWHGMAGKDGTGHISITVDQRDGQIVYSVEDDGAGRHAPKQGTADGVVTKKTSLGTAITRARLDLVQKQHGGRAGFRYTDLSQGTRVEVEMPLLRAF